MKNLKDIKIDGISYIVVLKQYLEMLKIFIQLQIKLQKDLIVLIK